MKPKDMYVHMGGQRYVLVLLVTFLSTFLLWQSKLTSADYALITVSIGVGGTNYIYNAFNTNATWTKASDERIKTNIQDLPIGLDFINELKVKSYNWKPNNEYPTDIIGYSEENTQDLNAVMYGMIAQDVKAAMDKLGYEHFGGWNEREADGLQGLSNEMFVLPLINAVKELAAQNNELKQRIEALEAK